MKPNVDYWCPGTSLHPCPLALLESCQVTCPLVPRTKEETRTRRYTQLNVCRPQLWYQMPRDRPPNSPKEHLTNLHCPRRRPLEPLEVQSRWGRSLTWQPRERPPWELLPMVTRRQSSQKRTTDPQKGSQKSAPHSFAPTRRVCSHLSTLPTRLLASSLRVLKLTLSTQ